VSDSVKDGRNHLGELLTSRSRKSDGTTLELSATQFGETQNFTVEICKAAKPVGDFGKMMAQLFAQVSQHPNFDIEAFHKSMHSLAYLTQVLGKCSDSPLWHVLIIVSRYSTSREKQESAERLCDWIRKERKILVKNAAVQDAIDELGSATGSGYLTESLQPGSILLAIGESEKPQEIRLGEKWVTDEKGYKYLETPINLSSKELLQWVKQTSLRLHREMLDYSTKTAKSQVDLQVFFDSSVPNPLDSLIAVEESRDARYKVAQLLSVATPKEQEFLHTLHQILKDSPGLEPKQALIKTRQILGISPAAGYQLLYRIRSKK
jgi:hypothetical protein